MATIYIFDEGDIGTLDSAYDWIQAALSDGERIDRIINFIEQLISILRPLEEPFVDED